MPTKYRYVPLVGRGPVWPADEFPVLIDGWPRQEDLDAYKARRIAAGTWGYED